MRQHHGKFRRQGVDEYIRRMNQPREKPVYDSTVTAMLVKAGFSIPEDPASIYDPTQLWDQYDRYCSNISFNEDGFIKQAISRAFRAFGFRSTYGYLTPLESEREYYSAIKLEKHAGVYFSNKLNAWSRAWTRKDEVLSGAKKPNPCLAGVRTQRGNKTRLVWMFPLEVTMLEARYAKPLIECFKEVRSPMPYGLRKCELGARLSSTLRERNLVALDFSKFDSSVPSHLIRVAFRILRTWFPPSPQIDHEFEMISNYFIKTPIVMIDGNLYTGKVGGVPSGSFFTQLVDSIVNFIIITAAMLKFDMKPHEKRVHILGDDSVFSTNQDVNLNYFKSYFETLGFKLNVEKSEVRHKSESIHFLGFDWLRGVPHRDVEKAVLSMTQPEKWRKREPIWVKENARALRLMMEMSTLGVNLYEVIRKVVHRPVREHLYLTPEVAGLTGYSKFMLEHHPDKIAWRNIAVGLWI